MSEPRSVLYRRFKPKPKPKASGDEGSIISEDEGGVHQKSSLFSDLRQTVTKSAQAMKSKVSRQRGKMVKIIRKRFPQKRKEVEDAVPIAGLELAEAYPPLYPQLRDSWLKVSADYIAKDLHRLIYRVTVVTNGEHEKLLEPPPQEERGSNLHCAQSVANLVKVLATHIETEEDAEKIHALCDEIVADVDEKTDLIDFNIKFFEELDKISKILRVLRCIHQSLVLKPYGILRTQVIKNKLTKDVRTEDGWQITISIVKEVTSQETRSIKVTHKRKEQSIDMPTPGQMNKEKNHWEYEWEVSMSFDKDMSDMNQSRLSITNLILSEGMDPALEKELREIMQSGNLIVF